MMAEYLKTPNRYVTNCPNCGAPLTSYGKCSYCGTVINQPLQLISVRPGVRKLTCQTRVPVAPDFTGATADAVARYATRDIQGKMAEALADAIKFTVRSDYDIATCADIICVRGELWVAEPDHWM